MNYVLGIDTSCYTTSVAILDEQGQLISDCRRILQVKTGGRGLRQSEMVFQHTRGLPELFAEACLPLGKPAFKAIGVSAFPVLCRIPICRHFWLGMAMPKYCLLHRVYRFFVLVIRKTIF